MSYFADTLVGQQIDAVLTDSEVTYIMLRNGTQVTIRGVVLVEPNRSASELAPAHSAELAG
jgi:hypothetical protein